MQLIKLSDVKKGDWVRLVRNGQPTAKTYQRDYYERSEKKYCLTDIDNINAWVFRKGETLVFLDCSF